MKTVIIVLVVVIACVLQLAVWKEPFGQARLGRQTSGRPQMAEPAVAARSSAAVTGEIQAEAVIVGEKQCDFPAVAVTADDAIWVAYVEWNGKDADRVLVRRKSGSGQWSEPMELHDGCWDHYSPAVAARGNNVLVVWSGQRDGNFELYAAEVNWDGKASSPIRLTSAPQSDFNARLASDGNGNVTLVWQSFRSGMSDIYVRRLSGNRWGQDARVASDDVVHPGACAMSLAEALTQTP